MLVAWRSDAEGQGRPDQDRPNQDRPSQDRPNQGRPDGHPIERLLPLLAIQRVELPKVEMERTADRVGAAQR